MHQKDADKRERGTGRVACVFLLSMCAVPAALAQSGPREMEQVEVIGTTPTPGAETERFRIPHRVVTIDSEELDRFVSTQISDHLARRVGGVFINEAQGNPLQPDVQYRGFTLSPLLGLPQGLALYQDGVRLNEVFGDTLNWELIPENAVDRIDLISGSDPLYGLNTLGGALSIRTKNGFSHAGHRMEFDGGSFGRTAPRLESGGNNGTLGYFLAASYERDDGWRDYSQTSVGNAFLSLGWRPQQMPGSLDLTVNYADSTLTGNGAAPVGLLALEGREAIFTAPDTTQNEMYMFNLSGQAELAPGISVSGNAFYRKNQTTSFNGDGTEFEEVLCVQDDGSGMDMLELETFLAEEDVAEGYVTPEDIGTEANQITQMDLETSAMLSSGTPERTVTVGSQDSKTLCNVENTGDRENLLPIDQNGAPVAAENDQNNARNAINNRSVRDQRSYGFSLQTALEHTLAERDNRLLVGGTYMSGEVDFNSNLEIGRIRDLVSDRSTVGEGIFIPGDGVRLDVDTRNYSGYLSDTFAVTEQIDFTASVRYNHTRIKLEDRGASDPLAAANKELTGAHSFSRFNPAAGLAWRPLYGLTVYGGYSESSRAPTAVELACADEDAPCNLPNAFLADPPLEQVVARTFELGLRWADQRPFNAELALFLTRNQDDILFQNTGGVTSSEGFFDNIGATRRLGLEAAFHGNVPVLERSLDWSVSYAYLNATYRSAFSASSPNNPKADSSGNIMVSPGDRIPGIPEHSVKAAVNFNVFKQFHIGPEVVYHSSRRYRGDEANVDNVTIDGYIQLNLIAEYRPIPTLQFFARVNNLLDTDYETFGLYGEPDEVFEDAGDPNEPDDAPYRDIENPRFVSPGAPINGFIGIRVAFE